MSDKKECDRCGGNGETFGDKCSECLGTGKRLSPDERVVLESKSERESKHDGIEVLNERVSFDLKLDHVRKYMGLDGKRMESFEIKVKDGPTVTFKNVVLTVCGCGEVRVFAMPTIEEKG